MMSDFAPELLLVQNLTKLAPELAPIPHIVQNSVRAYC